MMLRTTDPGGFIRFDAGFGALVGFTETELAARSLVSCISPADREVVRALIDRGAGSCHAHQSTASGGLVRLKLDFSRDQGQTVVLVRSPDGAPTPALDGEPAAEASVGGTLHTIAHIIEEQNPGYRCSILLVRDGRFVSGAGPSLPDDYNAAIDGYAVGPFVGSCGTAIYWNAPVIAEDLATDPLWAAFRNLTCEAGLGACWSHPFTTKGGAVLGALALYAPEPRSPTAEQLSRLRAAARMTGLAVERGRAEAELRRKRERERELEDQLRQAAKMKALGVLAGGVAHDFNNVLSTILANAELAMEVAPENQDLQEMLQEIVEASTRAGGFCQQMLAYAGHGSVQTRTIEVGALLPQVSGLVQAAMSKKVELEYRLAGAPICIEGDENQLLQVVMNLVTNAAEAIGDVRGRIVVETQVVYCDVQTLARLDPEARLPAGEYLQLSVTDTGCGMDLATQARIFDPFYTTKFTGRGLGLAATKGVIAKHRGAVGIQSKLGAGTRFTVFLPTVQTFPYQTETGAAAPLRGARGRVLLVDDEAQLRAALARRLRHEGFEVVEAADGQQAIDRFAEPSASFDCVLLDLSMPKLSGVEVHASILAQAAHVPVVLMSGYTAQEVVDRFRDRPLAGFLQKPVTAQSLLGALGQAMGARPDTGAR